MSVKVDIIFNVNIPKSTLAYRNDFQNSLGSQEIHRASGILQAPRNSFLFLELDHKPGACQIFDGIMAGAETPYFSANKDGENCRMIKQLLVSSAAVAAALALAAPAQATTTYYSGFTTAMTPDGDTPDVTFTAPGGSSVSVTVTDCCLVGDYYATYVDSTYVGTTPYVDPGGDTLSSGTFTATLGSGASHDFYLVDQVTSNLPAGVSVTITSVSGVPEPSSWAMMLMGVFGLGVAARVRRSGKLKSENTPAQFTPA